MTIRNFKRLFAARRTSDDGEALCGVWIGDEEEAVLVDADSGLLHAHILHDGYGKYDPTVYVWPWRALRLWRWGFVVSLLPFPRIAVELVRLKVASISEAQAEIEALLGLADGPDA